MQRRSFLLASAAGAVSLSPLRALAHHGWSSFDGTRPLYLEGRVASVRWSNPHAGFELEPAPGLKLPPDLAQRAVPAQQAGVDAAAVLAAAKLPKRLGERWKLELAPLSRMQAWGIEPLKAGDTVSLVGYAPAGEEGQALMRVEFLFAGGKAYGLRSSPAG